jgi:hypothetical protein
MCSKNLPFRFVMPRASILMSRGLGPIPYSYFFHPTYICI